MTEQETAVLSAATALIAKQERQLREARFKLAVAEWALSGLMSRNLHLNVGVSEIDLEQARNKDSVVRNIGACAGHKFFQVAELAFKDHAEMYRIKAQATFKDEYRQHIASEVPDSYTWPRPF